MRRVLLAGFTVVFRRSIKPVAGVNHSLRCAVAVTQQRSMASVQETTFMYQDRLPSLPVPPLDQTCRKYLESVKHLLSEEEYIQTEFIVNEFQSGIGKELHRKLEKRGKERRNWLEEWWENEAYLRPRYPLAPYINIGGPVTTMDMWPPEEGSQIKRAALFTRAMLQIWQLLYREQFEVHKMGSQPLCMNQFIRLFAECRVPGKDIDALKAHFKPAPASSPRHIMVQMRGRLFSCDVLDENYELYSAPEIERQLHAIVCTVESKPPGPCVGALTAEDRPTWYKLRERLQSLDANNAKYLNVIEKALFNLILEEHDAPEYQEIARHAVVGDCRNRWFDKSIALLAFKSGTFATHCDHSPFDGIVEIDSVIAAYALLSQSNGKWQGREDIRNDSKPVELDFVVDKEILTGVDKAIEKYESVANNILYMDCTVTDYGKRFMKAQGIHPDTYCQLAAQLTYYRIHNKPAPTYETAQTRQFFHGRTDTVRSCTAEALNWCKAMLDKHDVATKSRLLRKAVDKHNVLMKEAVNGQGIDRHFLGLSLIAAKEEMPTPQIYVDKAWKASGGGANFVLSTSCTGFSPVHGGCAPMVHHGYGFFYSITDDAIYFHLSTWKDSKETDGPRFEKGFTQSLRDMRQLLQSAKL